MHHDTWRRSMVALLGLFLLGCADVAAAKDGVVEGWFKAGNDPQGYEIGTVETDRGRVAYIRGLEPEPKKFGTLMQSFTAADHRGKRIRLRAMVRTQDVTGWVGMWMRVDVGDKTASFDNMQNRALRGSTDWQQCDIVLDVPDDADIISMGIILAGPGRAEWDAIAFETVANDVPLTCMYAGKQSKGPTNLNFEQ